VGGERFHWGELCPGAAPAKKAGGILRHVVLHQCLAPLDDTTAKPELKKKNIKHIYQRQSGLAKGFIFGNFLSKLVLLQLALPKS